MTSHYVCCVVKERFERVFESLSGVFGNIYSRRMRKSDGFLFGVILGEKYFLRVRSDVAISIIVEGYATDETRVEVVSCAGGTGLLGISYGAHSAYVHDVINYLKDSGLEVTVEREIPYFSEESTETT